MKKKVEGIILILSCNKYRYSRLVKYRLKSDNYSGWKVIYVIGNLFIDNEYILEDNLLTVKCEDSYIHLLKKLVLSLKYLYQIYDIKQGVLRCGDDLIFNEEKLFKFVESKDKLDFIGINGIGKSFIANDENINFSTHNDIFMKKYYEKHPEDIENPLHNLKNINFSNYTKLPYIPDRVAGTLFYISNKSVNFLIEKLEEINYNIFYLDEKLKCYPYIIEDCGVSFILFNKNINLNFRKDFINIEDNKINPGELIKKYIAYHTQEFNELSFIMLNLEDCIVMKSNEEFKGNPENKKYLVISNYKNNDMNNKLFYKKFYKILSMINYNFDVLLIDIDRMENWDKKINFVNQYVEKEYHFVILKIEKIGYLSNKNHILFDPKYLDNRCKKHSLNLYSNIN